MFEALVHFVRDVYRTNDFIALHEPRFWGNEKSYVADAIDSTFVSSAGQYVSRFENAVADATGAAFAVATVNGTTALHVAMMLTGVIPGDLVITQPLTFVATCNAIRHCGADPVFVDVDEQTLGLSPSALASWLELHAEMREGHARQKATGRTLRACVPMHTFGFPADIDGILEVCQRWGIAVVEDAAESLGSLRGGRHTGTAGRVGILSFNGNKIVTTGGGGAILTNDESLAKRAKHVTSTAKLAHPWAFNHDEVAFNYRMPNLNAALGCAQLESLSMYVQRKRWLAEAYAAFFESTGLRFVTEPIGTRSNYWLNSVRCADRKERDELLAYTTSHGVMTRPAWTLMTELPMFRECFRGPLPLAVALSDTIVNLPSSVVAK